MLTSHELLGFMSPALATEILNYAYESDKALYRGALSAVAEARKLRPVFLERQPRTERHTAMLQTLARPSLDLVTGNLIRAWLLKKYNSMLCDFLDALGIAHKEGVVEDLPATMDDAKLRAAVDALLAKYPAEVVAVYLNAFNDMNEVNWPNLNNMEPKADIALIGLAVMGQNLILNMNDHGFTVVAFNRTVSKVDDFLNNEAKGTQVIGAHSIEEMVGLLKKPRRVMLMVKAGQAVDEFIEHLLPHLEPGDIIIDGGNSLFEDTTRRTKYVESKGLLYIGTGVSGGEDGARHGPSIMPGGSSAAWPDVKDIFQKIAAKVEDGAPCCERCAAQ